MPNRAELAQAQELHRQSLVIDCLNTSRLDTAQVERFREAGVDAFHWTVASPYDDWQRALQSIGYAHHSIEQHSDTVSVATCADDILQARDTGKVAAILGLQNARPIDYELDRLDILWRLGIRVIQLTYNERNVAGDGCDEPGNAGLSRFGYRLVSALNERQILVDLSHCSAATTLDAVKASTKPVAITHANVRTLCDTPRNKSDEEMQAVAKSGGIIGAVIWGPLSGADRRPTIDDLIDHTEHVLNLAGEEAVSIGTDYSESIYSSATEWEDNLANSEGLYPQLTAHVGDWYRYEQRYVTGLETIARLPYLTAGLIERGLGMTAIRGILGENALRTFRAACG